MHSQNLLFSSVKSSILLCKEMLLFLKLSMSLNNLFISFMRYALLVCNWWSWAHCTMMETSRRKHRSGKNTAVALSFLFHSESLPKMTKMTLSYSTFLYTSLFVLVRTITIGWVCSEMFEKSPSLNGDHHYSCLNSHSYFLIIRKQVKKNNHYHPK